MLKAKQEEMYRLRSTYVAQFYQLFSPLKRGEKLVYWLKIFFNHTFSILVVNLDNRYFTEKSEQP